MTTGAAGKEEGVGSVGEGDGRCGKGGVEGQRAAGKRERATGGKGGAERQRAAGGKVRRRASAVDVRREARRRW
ncbi:Os06g0165201 [Oryza sativa Japonica Group]|uniref:Os06g0165201 protein n=1 Tax=Oryza sativa subsp. japonica TaxID=39947 RepID=A0A0P0WTA0_ORYSJ|nr:Os06g0165201 [Oryza sativa Japonica Group]